MDRWIEYGLRDDVPTGPKEPGDAVAAAVVTLTTPPSQEAYTFVRPNFDGNGVNGNPVNRRTHPDLDPRWKHIYPFYAPAVTRTFERLGELRSSTLYIFASDSSISDAKLNAEKLATTGTAVGGSGGVAAGQVDGVTFDGVGHLIPMEAPQRTAEVVAEWIDQQLRLWRKDEEEFRSMWHAKTKKQRQEVDDRWVEMVGGAPKKSKGKKKGSGSSSKI